MRYTATFAFASSGKKIPVHLLFRELTGPEFERTQSQFQNDEMEYVYENESATWDESTVLLFLEEMLLPYIESHGGGEHGTKRTALFYDVYGPHRTEKVLAFYKKHKIDRFEIPASLTHVLQAVDQIASIIKGHIAESWCVFMQNSIKQGHFHQNSKNYKPPSKADLIKWTLDAWDNIDCGMLEKVARKCYMSPYDLDDDMEIYGPLHAGVDINADDFKVLPQHNVALEEDLPAYDPFEKW